MVKRQRALQPVCSLILHVAALLFFSQTVFSEEPDSGSQETFAFPLHKGFPVQVYGDLMTSVVVADIDNDHQMELCFSLRFDGGTYLLRSNGQNYSSAWPKTTGSQTPSLVDIDFDGFKEIVSVGLVINVWNSDGSLVPGWPHEFDGGASDSVSVLDLDRNKSPEMVVGYGYGTYYLTILSSQGTDLSGYPIQAIDNISYSPGLADLDSDGTYEVIVGHDDYFADMILAYDIYGNLFQGNWLVDLGGMGLGGVRSNVTVADVDGDQRPEIMFATDVSRTEGHIDAVVLNHDGTFAQGWPKEVYSWMYGGLSAGDIDGDGKLEVACATIADGPDLHSEVYVWNGEDGTDLPGWPKIVTTSTLVGNVIIGDIDGDCERELVIAGRVDIPRLAYIYAWHRDGSDVTGFPLIIDSYSVYGYSSCFIADIDNDSLVEIGIGVTDDSSLSRIYVWDLPYKYRKDCQDWPQYRHDCQHTGNYHFPEGLPILSVPTLSLGSLLVLLGGFAVFMRVKRRM